MRSIVLGGQLVGEFAQNSGDVGMHEINGFIAGKIYQDRRNSPLSYHPIEAPKNVCIKVIRVRDGTPNYCAQRLHDDPRTGAQATAWRDVVKKYRFCRRGSRETVSSMLRFHTAILTAQGSDAVSAVSDAKFRPEANPQPATAPTTLELVRTNVPKFGMRVR